MDSEEHEMGSSAPMATPWRSASGSIRALRGSGREGVARCPLPSAGEPGGQDAHVVLAPGGAQERCEHGGAGLLG
jgi:hypothetical protein